MVLPKKYRLSLVGKRVFGQIHEGPIFKLVFVKNKREKHFAFVIATRLSKKAVVRNKIKRRLIEGIRGLLRNLKNGDYVFYVKREIIGKDFWEIRNELKRFLFKEGFLENAKSFGFNSQKL